MELENEIKVGRKQVQTDDTKMTFGELANLYKEKDIIISPEYQRAFRWSDEQKTRLIESILLGIPLPSIFVASDPDGRWEVVDGLQRVSTLLQFFGLLEDRGFPPLVLMGTEYLPHLEGAVWDNPDTDSGQYLLPAKYKRDIKRASIDIKIVLSESKGHAKFDLFQRLNSFGSVLTAQEVRSAILYAISPRFVNWLHKVASSELFDSLLGLSEAKKNESFAEELVLRFLFMCGKDELQIKAVKHFTEEMNQYFETVSESFDDEIEERFERLFVDTFTLIAKQEENLLRKWDPDKGQFTQGFNLTAFEAVACGFGYAVYHNLQVVDNAVEVVKAMWEIDKISEFSTGKSTEQRVHAVVPIGINKLIKRAE